MPSQNGSDPSEPSPAGGAPNLLTRTLNGIRDAQRIGLLSDQDARALAAKVAANLRNVRMPGATAFAEVTSDR